VGLCAWRSFLGCFLARFVPSLIRGAYVRPLALLRGQLYVHVVVGGWEKLRLYQELACDTGFWKWITEENKTSRETE
jgi:hypothetical protein